MIIFSSIILAAVIIGAILTVIQYRRSSRHLKELQAKWDSFGAHPNYNQGLSDIWHEVYEKDKK